MKSCSQSTNTAPGICPARVLGALGVRQRRARMPAADIEHAHPCDGRDGPAASPPVTSGPSGVRSSCDVRSHLRFLSGATAELEPAARLGLFGHRDQVLPGDLADQLGVIRRACAPRSHVAASSTVSPRPRNPHWHRMTFAMTISCLSSATLRPPVCTASAILLAPTLADNPGTRIQLCGRLAVELAGRDLTAETAGRPARVLFTYLAVTRGLPSAA